MFLAANFCLFNPGGSQEHISVITYSFLILFLLSSSNSNMNSA